MITKRIILDTDIDTDCDDAGAMAVLHALAGRRECEILAVVCSVPVAGCAGAVHAINTWYGRAEVPIGQVNVPDYEQAPNWRAYREHHARFARGEFGIRSYHERLMTGIGQVKTEEAVSLYRRLLAGAPERSVTICAIGTLTALAQLLASRPDAHSPLSGVELVKQKVAELVSMAVVEHPRGREAFNWRMDLISAAQVVRDWPTPLTISSKGDTVLTGARFIAAAAAGQPVREAYATCLGGTDRNRPSWDLIAVLYAVRGLVGPFVISPEHGLILEPDTGEHIWTNDPRPAERQYVTPTRPDDAMAQELEDLMITSLECRGPQAG